jgi:hypothetical protein
LAAGSDCSSALESPGWHAAATSIVTMMRQTREETNKQLPMFATHQNDPVDWGL